MRDYSPLAGVLSYALDTNIDCSLFKMAFSFGYVAKICILFEIAIISGIASEIPTSWKNFGGE